MRRPITVFAHRGTGSERIENTVDAFGWAVGHGANWLETDVRSTHDGHLVCLHDATLDRTTAGSGAVTSMTLREVEALGVPSLAEAVAAFPGTSWNVEIKQRRPDIVPLMARFLVEGGLEARFRVASFSGRRIRSFRRLTRGRVRTAAPTDETVLAWLAARVGLRPPRPRYDALQIPLRQIVQVTDRRVIDAAHRSGVEVHVWTVNEVDEALALLELGVDGIFTDRFDLMAPALGL